jgi:hypothetical protein
MERSSKVLFVCYFLSLSLSRTQAALEKTVACPRYFLCDTGGRGLGDQLENYVFCSYCAKLLNATLVVNGFHEAPKKHHGSGMEYRDVALLLGIDFTLNKSTVEQHLDAVELSFPQVHSLHEEIVNGSRKSACNLLYTSHMKSCPGIRDRWCDFLPSYDSLKSTLWKLRRNHARQKCFDRGLGFKASSTVNIVWHVRAGDICLHCDDPQYYTSLYARLMTASPELLASHQLVFESQGTIDFLRNHDTFKHATFNSSPSVVESVCRFLTSDILITSGSSLPAFVAAFAPPWSPIVLEERRKEASVGDKMAHHFFNEDEAVLLEDGRPLLTDSEFSTVLESILGEKLWQREGRRPPS